MLKLNKHHLYALLLLLPLAFVGQKLAALPVIKVNRYLGLALIMVCFCNYCPVLKQLSVPVVA